MIASRRAMSQAFAAVVRRLQVAGGLRRLFSDGAPLISVSSVRSRLRREFDPDKALSLLSSVKPQSPSPLSDRFAVDVVVRRLSRHRRLDDVKSLLDSRRRSLPATEAAMASIILTYGTAGLVDDAVSLFRELPSILPSKPTVASLNALLSACVKGGQPHRVPELFSELTSELSINPDYISYSILIKAHSLSNSSDKAVQILKEMEEKGEKLNAVSYTTVLHALYSEGKTQEGDDLWSEISKDCKPDLTAYNVKAMRFAFEGKHDLVIDLIKEMQENGLKPDTITYNYLMTSYFKAGMHEDARNVYKGLAGKGCGPNATTFNVLVASLSKAGDLDGALAAFKGSLRTNKIPRFKTLRTLVLGLAKESRVENAKEVIREMKGRFSQVSRSGWKKLEKDLGLEEDDSTENAVPA